MAQITGFRPLRVESAPKPEAGNIELLRFWPAWLRSFHSVFFFSVRKVC
jgi:hypothetical protein